MCSIAWSNNMTISWSHGLEHALILAWNSRLLTRVMFSACETGFSLMSTDIPVWTWILLWRHASSLADSWRKQQNRGFTARRPLQKVKLIYIEIAVSSSAQFCRVRISANLSWIKPFQLTRQRWWAQPTRVNKVSSLSPAKLCPRWRKMDASWRRSSRALSCH